MPAATPEPSASSPHRRGTRWGGLLRGALVAYLLLLLGVTAGQEFLLFPGAALDRQAPLAVPPGAELRAFPSGPERVTALWGEALGAADPKNPPVVLLFYGNGSTLAASVGTFQRFRRLGCAVLMPDYLGYGLSSGRPGEASCRATATACHDELTVRLGIPPSRIRVAGYSLGGAVAIGLAARRPVAGLAAFNAFTSMSEVAQRRVPWAPVGWLLRHPFAAEKDLERVRCPVFLAGGAEDALVPVDMTLQLARTAGVPARVVRGAGHNNLFARAEPAFWAELRAFLHQPERFAPGAAPHLPGTRP
jgi:pimeloyl-ACP methyl ester carboxylesterase